METQKQDKVSKEQFKSGLSKQGFRVACALVLLPETALGGGVVTSGFSDTFNSDQCFLIGSIGYALCVGLFVLGSVNVSSLPDSWFAPEEQARVKARGAMIGSAILMTVIGFLVVSVVSDKVEEHERFKKELNEAVGKSRKSIGRF